MREKFPDFKIINPQIEHKFLSRHLHSKKILSSMRPAYPGYLFVHLAGHGWFELKAFNGVLGILSSASIPIWVPENKINFSPELTQEEFDGISKGDRVALTVGPFKGLPALFLGEGFVEMNLFGSVRKISVPLEILEKMS
jgi:transcription antitermination factor NusG